MEGDDIKISTDCNKCRAYASITFAALLLGLGVPLWWHTTAVPRAPIPFSEISELGQVDFVLGSRLMIGCSTIEKAKRIRDSLDILLQNADLYKFQLSYHQTSNVHLSKNSDPKEFEDIEKYYGVQTGDLLLLELEDSSDGIIVGSGRTIYFSRKTEVNKIFLVLDKYILRNDALVLTRNALNDPAKYSLDEENRRRFPASPSFDVLLTFINSNPDQLRLERSLSKNINDHLKPFLDNISILADFTVKSQWLYLVSLGVQTYLVSDSAKPFKYFLINRENLPHIITSLEKKLASQVSLNPTINLISYFVPCNEAPVLIDQDRDVFNESSIEAFHSPRWGGVALVNPSTAACNNQDKFFQPNEKIIAGIYLTHLRLLLGIPVLENIPDVTVAPLKARKIRDWELDGLLRVRSVEQVTLAKLTLQSLAELLDKISNIVITKEVSNQIKNALELIQTATKLLKKGDLEGGFLAGKKAFVISETAFTDPSLLALLYFPDDQKYAVYIPLFLPIMIPVLFSLKNIKKCLADCHN